MRSLWNALMAPGRSMRLRAEKLKEQQARFEAALKHLNLDRIVGDYQPGLTQELLDTKDWKTPWPTAELIEQERTRIARYLEEHWRQADFPEQPVFLVRVGMEKVWGGLQGHIHQRVFGRLDLPPFFDLQRDPNGLILFEMTRHDTDHYGNEEWIGVNSRWIYGRNPPQLSDPLSEAAT